MQYVLFQHRLCYGLLKSPRVHSRNTNTSRLSHKIDHFRDNRAARYVLMVVIGRCEHVQPDYTFYSRDQHESLYVTDNEPSVDSRVIKPLGELETNEILLHSQCRRSKRKTGRKKSYEATVTEAQHPVSYCTERDLENIFPGKKKTSCVSPVRCSCEFVARRHACPFYSFLRSQKCPSLSFLVRDTR